MVIYHGRISKKSPFYKQKKIGDIHKTTDLVTSIESIPPLFEKKSSFPSANASMPYLDLLARCLDKYQHIPQFTMVESVKHHQVNTQKQCYNSLL